MDKQYRALTEQEKRTLLSPRGRILYAAMLALEALTIAVIVLGVFV